MRLWRDLTRIFFAGPTSRTLDAAGEHSRIADTSHKNSDRTRPPGSDASRQPVAALIEPFGGALIRCNSKSISYTPLVDSVPVPQPLPTTQGPLTHVQSGTMPSETQTPPNAPQPDDDAPLDHEVARAAHATAQADHATQQADAALSRKNLRAFEEDIARAQQALDAHSVVEQIQRRMRVRPWHMLFGIGAVVAALTLALLGERLISAMVALGSVAPFLWLHFRWLARLAFRLHYELGTSYDRAYADLLIACQRLENAGAEWCVAHGVKAADPPSPGPLLGPAPGPQTLLQRASRRFRVARACPPWIRCNLTPPMIPTQGRKLYLFPDHALLFERGRVRAIVYTDMRFTTRPVEAPPTVGQVPGPIPTPQRAPSHFTDITEPNGIRSQTVGHDVTSHLPSHVRRVLDRRWTGPIVRPDLVRSMETAIQSQSQIAEPPTGVNLNALHVSQLDWNGPAGPDTIHLISPANDAIALTNAVTRLGSVYAAGLRRSHDSH